MAQLSTPTTDQPTAPHMGAGAVLLALIPLLLLGGLLDQRGSDGLGQRALGANFDVTLHLRAEHILVTDGPTTGTACERYMQCTGRSLPRQGVR